MDGPGNIQQQVAGVHQQIIVPGGAIPMEANGNGNGNGNNVRQQIQPPQPQPGLVLPQGHPQLQQQHPRHWNGLGNQQHMRMYAPAMQPGNLREEQRRLHQQQAVNQGAMPNYMQQVIQHHGRMPLNRPHHLQNVNGLNPLVMWNQMPPQGDVEGRDAVLQRYIADQVEGEAEEEQNQREITKRQLEASVIIRLEAAAAQINGTRRTRIHNDIAALRGMMCELHNMPPEQLFAGPIDHRELADPPADTIGNEIAKEIDEMYRNGVCSVDAKGAPINRHLDEILRCGVCFLPIRRPQTLGCGHTVCSPCMENMVQMTRQRDMPQREVPHHQIPPQQLHLFQGGEIGVFNFGPLNGAAGHMNMLAGFPAQVNRRPQANHAPSNTTISCPVCRRPCNIPQGGITVNYKLQEIIDRLLREQADFKLRPHQQYKNCSECKKEIYCSYYFSCQDCATKTEPDVVWEDSELQQNVLCATCTVRQHNGHAIVEHASLTKELIEESKKRLEEDYGKAAKLVDESVEELKSLNTSTKDKFQELLSESLQRMKTLISKLDSKDVVNWNRAQLMKNEDLSENYLRKVQDIVTTQVQHAIETHRQANEAVFSKLANIRRDFDDAINNCRTPVMDDCIQIQPGRGRPKEEIMVPKVEDIVVMLENDVIVENMIAAGFPLQDPADLMPDVEEANFQYREGQVRFNPNVEVVLDGDEDYEPLDDYVPDEPGTLEQLLHHREVMDNEDPFRGAYQDFPGYYLNGDDANRPGPSGINNNIANNRVPRLRTRPPRAAVFSPSPEPSRKRHKS